MARVQLVARLRDERLNFPQSNELHVFIPPRLQWLIDPRTARNIYASVGKSSRPKTSRK
jgi:hypothetical protein